MISIGHGLACGRCMRCKGRMAAEHSTKSGCNASLDISPPPILQAWPALTAAYRGMERLDVLLGDVLDRHKAHGRTRHGCRDGLGITAVVFVRLDIRLDALRCPELDLVAIRADASRPVRGTTTGFHADEHWGQLRHKRDQRMPG